MERKKEEWMRDMKKEYHQPRIEREELEQEWGVDISELIRLPNRIAIHSDDRFYVFVVYTYASRDIFGASGPDDRQPTPYVHRWGPKHNRDPYASKGYAKAIWSELSCEGKQMMNWVAWILIYLLTVNPIINPLITSLIYAPYRMTIKKFLVNIPVGNRPFYNYQGEHLHLDSRSVLR
ncbi:hypothetical protein ANCCEY_11477 [Ancylostoma ceylanicum]|uniref:Uncharacterized protein n=1 Tax=Ancylostoma ceylanicum TaxID=53326 RepID=A0A0D6LC38_9BILA|nr:hypothetical protein ANCCEY_11477 [Ancylostoma ceylanicum]